MRFNQEQRFHEQCERRENSMYYSNIKVKDAIYENDDSSLYTPDERFKHKFEMMRREMKVCEVPKRMKKLKKRMNDYIMERPELLI